MAFSQPSEFWSELGKIHQKDLIEFGLDSIKRRQAFKYFNWNWRWSTIRQSEQLRFLLRHLDLKTLASCTLSPATLQDASWTGAPLGRADRWLYTVCTRMLWAYAQKHDSIKALQLEEPLVGQPLPVYWKNRLISQDLANTSLELSSVQRALGKRNPSNVLEIGAGYGRTAYVFLKLYPESTYTIVDIEPALSISRGYLTKLFPEERLHFIAAENIGQIKSSSYSLSLSISSLQEMRPDQIHEYLTLMDRVTESDGVIYLKQWTDWHNPRDNFTARFSDYPIPEHWKPLFREAAPIQTRFTQAAWTK